MKFISHRGNLIGPMPENENKPSYILNALNLGFDCECDVWLLDDGFFWLGHDGPQYKIMPEFLMRQGLWVHAKNYDALTTIVSNFPDVNVFFHDKDPYTLTSHKFIWAYPGQKLRPGCTICVMPERVDYSFEEKKLSYGICSDYIVRERIEFQFK